MSNWPRDAFGLWVRVAGFVFAVYALFDAFHAVAKTFNFEAPSSAATLTYDLAGMIFFAVLAMVVIVRAERIVALAYGRQLAARHTDAPGQ